MNQYEAEAFFARIFEGWELDKVFPPVGGPAYVRRLRDQAAVASLAGYRASDDPGADLRLEDLEQCVVDADALLRALGYTPPGEPGKETP